MTDLNQEDATMLQGLQDALMHLTNRLLNATEVANSVSDLQTKVIGLTNQVTGLSSDVETYRNRNLDLDAALSAVRRERDNISVDYNELSHVNNDLVTRLRTAENDRDEAINKQLEADQRADDLGQTIKRLQDDLHLKNLETASQEGEIYSLKAKLAKIKEAVADLSGAAVDPVAEADPVPEPEAVAGVPAIQAIEERELPQEPAPSSEGWDRPWGSSYDRNVG